MQQEAALDTMKGRGYGGMGRGFRETGEWRALPMDSGLCSGRGFRTPCKQGRDRAVIGWCRCGGNGGGRGAGVR